MTKKYIYKKLNSKKILICLVLGFILLIVCLSWTPGYFNLDEEKLKSTFTNFAKNLHNSTSPQGSLKDWFTKGVKEWDNYLKDNVQWWGTLITVAAFIAACFPIFQFIGRDILRIKNEDIKPLTWDIKTDILKDLTASKLLSLGAKKIKKKVSKQQAAPKIKKAAPAKKLDFKSLPANTYLFLIDKLTPQDHFALLWNMIAIQLEKAGINTDRYYYQGDPNTCFSESHEGGLSLEQLKELHPESILVIVGDGNSVFKKDQSKLAKWTSLLKLWNTRYLFDSKYFQQPDVKKSLLNELFHVLPAKVSSLKYLTIQPNKKGKLKNSKQHKVDESTLAVQQEKLTATTLDKIYSQPTLDWIKSCSLYPNLQYDLSLELGREIFQKNNADFSEEVMLSAFELPWFRQGEMPKNIKAETAKKFAITSPENEQLARKFLELKLPGLRPPSGSYASLINNEFENINKWFIKDPAPTKEVNKTVRKNLTRIYNSADIEPDGLLEITKGPHNKYSKYIASPSLRKFVFNKGFSGLGVTLAFRNTIYSIMAGITLLLTVLFIIWLSRPTEGELCLPITQMMEVPNNDSLSMEYEGSEDNPIAAYFIGTEPCLSKFEVTGQDVEILTSNSSVKQSSENSNIRVVSLNQEDTLKVLMKSPVTVKAKQKFEVTLIACPNDTVGYKLSCYNNRSSSENVPFTLGSLPPIAVDLANDGFPLLNFKNGINEYEGKYYSYSSITKIQDSTNSINCEEYYLFLVKHPYANYIHIDTTQQDTTINICEIIDPPPKKPCDCLERLPAIEPDCPPSRPCPCPCDEPDVHPSASVSVTINCEDSTRHFAETDILDVSINDSDFIQYSKNLIFKDGDSAQFRISSSTVLPITLIDNNKKYKIETGENLIKLIVDDPNFIPEEVQLNGEIILTCQGQGNLLRNNKYSSDSLIIALYDLDKFKKYLKHDKGRLCINVLYNSFCDSKIVVSAKHDIFPLQEREIYLRDFERRDNILMPKSIVIDVCSSN